MGRSSQARPVREGVPPRARGDRVPVGLPRGTRGVVALRDLLADGVVELQERGELIDEAFDLARAGPEHWEVAPGFAVWGAPAPRLALPPVRAARNHTKLRYAVLQNRARHDRAGRVAGTE